MTEAINNIIEAAEQFNHWAMMNSHPQRIIVELTGMQTKPTNTGALTPEPQTNVGKKCIIHKEDGRYWGEILREYQNGFDVAITVNGTNVVWGVSNVEIRTKRNHQGN